MPGLIMSRFRGLSGGSRAPSLAPAAPQIASHTSVRFSEGSNMTAWDWPSFLLGVLVVLPFWRRLEGYGRALARRCLK